MGYGAAWCGRLPVTQNIRRDRYSYVPHGSLDQMARSPDLHSGDWVRIPTYPRRVGVYGCMRVFQTQGASSNLAHCTKVILAKRFRLALLRQRDWFDSNRSHKCAHSIMESVQGYEPWRLEFDSSWAYKCPLSIFGDAPVL
jgi:hypothetical protein